MEINGKKYKAAVVEQLRDEGPPTRLPDVELGQSLQQIDDQLLFDVVDIRLHEPARSG